MFDIWREPSIPQNVVALPCGERRAIREHYERGDVVVLTDARIEGDFGLIASVEPQGEPVRRGKYAFRKNVRGKPARRDAIWERFFGQPPDGPRQERIRSEIRSIDDQMDRLIRTLFAGQRFSEDFTIWKFEKVRGENLHIDNLANLNRTTQLRLFANVDENPRLWSVGRHWRYYVDRHFDSAGLADVLDDAVEFNGRLNHAAFGGSRDECDEPRHLLSFEPGTIWLANSALVAHQVRAGDRLCSAHYEYPFRDCLDPKTALPAQIRSAAKARGIAQPGGWRRAIVNRVTQGAF